MKQENKIYREISKQVLNEVINNYKINWQNLHINNAGRFLAANKDVNYNIWELAGDKQWNDINAKYNNILMAESKEEKFKLYKYFYSYIQKKFRHWYESL